MITATKDEEPIEMADTKRFLFSHNNMSDKENDRSNSEKYQMKIL